MHTCSTHMQAENQYGLVEIKVRINIEAIPRLRLLDNQTFVAVSTMDRKVQGQMGENGVILQCT